MAKSKHNGKKKNKKRNPNANISRNTGALNNTDKKPGSRSAAQNDNDIPWNNSKRAQPAVKTQVSDKPMYMRIIVLAVAAVLILGLVIGTVAVG